MVTFDCPKRRRRLHPGAGLCPMGITRAAARPRTAMGQLARPRCKHSPRAGVGNHRARKGPWASHPGPPHAQQARQPAHRQGLRTPREPRRACYSARRPGRRFEMMGGEADGRLKTMVSLPRSGEVVIVTVVTRRGSSRTSSRLKTTIPLSGEAVTGRGGSGRGPRAGSSRTSSGGCGTWIGDARLKTMVSLP